MEEISDMKRKLSLALVLILILTMIPQTVLGLERTTASDAEDVLDPIFDELTDTEQSYLTDAKAEINSLADDSGNQVWLDIFEKLNVSDDEQEDMRQFIADFTAIYFTTSDTLAQDIDDLVNNYDSVFGGMLGENDAAGAELLYDIVDLMTDTFNNIGVYVNIEDMENLSDATDTDALMDTVADILKKITSDEDTDPDDVLTRLQKLGWGMDDLIDSMLMLLRAADDSDRNASQALANAIVRSKASRASGSTSIKVGKTTSYTISLFGKTTNLVKFALEDETKGTFSGPTLTAEETGTTEVRAYRRGVDPAEEPLNYIFSFDITISSSSDSHGGGGGGGGGGGDPEPEETPTTTPTTDDKPVAVSKESVKTEVKEENGKQVASVTVDKAAVQKVVEDNEAGSTVVIDVDQSADVVKAALTGDVIQQMEEKEMKIAVTTEKASYSVPAKELNVNALVEQLKSEDGEAIDTSQVSLSVVIAEPADETVQVVENEAAASELSIVVPPIEFDLVCEYGDKSVKVSKFNSYVERTIKIPDGVNASKITTAVVQDDNGKLTHVPTEVIKIDGKYYAKIKSLTNSVYTVVYNKKEFADVANHWAKNDVNDMGSRLIINGTTKTTFEPDRGITRAEFMAIVVRSMGLMRNSTGHDAFSGVASSAWYYNVVSIAHDYGLTNGNGDGTFTPNSEITREEAMVMVARALKIAGINPKMSASDMNAALGDFADSSSISDWAQSSAALCVDGDIIGGYDGKISAQNNITRAECAAVIKRMLQKADLI